VHGSSQGPLLSAWTGAVLAHDGGVAAWPDVEIGWSTAVSLCGKGRKAMTGAKGGCRILQKMIDERI